MENLLTQLLFQSIAMALTVGILPNLMISSIFGPVLMVAAITAVNHYFWDSALFYSLPTDFSTRTMTLLFINGALFWILVKVLPGIEMIGFLPAIAGPLVFTAVNIAIQEYGRDIDWSQLMREIRNIMHEIKMFMQSAVGSSTDKI